jgi:hypothetical protein
MIQQFLEDFKLVRPLYRCEYNNQPEQSSEMSGIHLSVKFLDHETDEKPEEPKQAVITIVFQQYSQETHLRTGSRKAINLKTVDATQFSRFCSLFGLLRDTRSLEEREWSCAYGKLFWGIVNMNCNRYIHVEVVMKTFKVCKLPHCDRAYT